MQSLRAIFDVCGLQEKMEVDEAAGGKYGESEDLILAHSYLRSLSSSLHVERYLLNTPL